jgi:tRNA threonylcarbamoyl adenosine modification protein (Sua5/YciO/YrdC/YwlC family)
MKTLKLYGTAINTRFIDEAVEAMRDGQIIIYPTDTLYAIGCDALNNRAIEKICRLKGIDPSKNQLSIACADMSQAAAYARIDNRAFAIIKRNTPGPFTFILPSSTTLPKVFKGRKQVGIRIPDDPIATTLASQLGNPLLTTSIELDDIVDDDMAEVATLEIAMKYDNDVALLLDSGSRGVVGSAIVDLTDSDDPQIVRQGPIELR